jgi:hypothetical protein
VPSHTKVTDIHQALRKYTSGFHPAFAARYTNDRCRKTAKLCNVGSLRNAEVDQLRSEWQITLASA